MGWLRDFLEKRPPRREPVQIEVGVVVTSDVALAPFVWLVMAAVAEARRCPSPPKA